MNPEPMYNPDQLQMRPGHEGHEAALTFDQDNEKPHNNKLELAPHDPRAIVQSHPDHEVK